MDASDDLHAFDVAIVGAGPAGLTAALGFSRGGLRTALIARRAPYADNRTTALLGASIDWLSDLGVWDACVAQAAPMRAMRLVDDTGRLVRSPEITFRADEISREAFGYNIENRDLVAALEAATLHAPGLVRCDADAARIEPGSTSVMIETAGGARIEAALVIGADGRQSLCRQAAGISVRQQPYRQSALTFNVRHTRPHRDASTEFHTSEGPCVIVPLPGQRSSVVWVVTPERASMLSALDDAALSDAIERQSHSILGRMQVEPGRFIFPLSVERPSALAGRRIALIGEAAHVVPPIGAQGLNLGLRDAREIVALAVDAARGGADPGSPDVLSRYAAARRRDIEMRTRMIDAANRVLLSEFLPVQALRAVGMSVLSRAGPLRALAMRGGLGEPLMAGR